MEPTLPSSENHTVPPANLGNGFSESNHDVGVTSEVGPIEVKPKPATSKTTADDTTVLADNSVQPAVVNITTTPQPMDDSTPTVADDVDVIEKEWVNKARSIVDATRDDPYKQEKEVSKLQAEYLLKRYGKQVKISE